MFFMLIGISILFMLGAANHKTEYISSHESGPSWFVLYNLITIDSAGTTYVANAIKVADHNSFSLRIQENADSLGVEYFLGCDTSDLRKYPANWKINTINTGTDPDYVSGIFCNLPFATHAWLRFINLKLVDRDSIPVYFSGKVQ